MAKSNKQAKAAFSPRPAKRAKADDSLARAYRSRPPVWSFARHAKGGSFAWTALGEPHFPRVFDALAGYEAMPWGQIEAKPHCHPIDVEDCHHDIGQYLAQQGWDIDSLFQLSIGNKGRLFGERIDHVFRVMFWDADHQVYETQKRNT